MQSKGKFGWLLLASVCLSACASNEPPPSPPSVSENRVSALIAASCPADTVPVPPETVNISAERVDWAETEERAGKAFGPLHPKAVFALTSDDARIGGLSGIDFLDDQTLIAVSDFGSLVWLSLSQDEEGIEPRARVASLRDETGGMLDSKKLTDAEGVAWTGKTLFVSFERNHRVFGYDITACGSAARGMSILEFDDENFGLGRAIDENSGIEALAVRGESQLILGLESIFGGSPVGLFGADTTEAGFTQRLPSPELTMLTGMDIVPGNGGPDRLYSLARSYDPIRGNRIAISVTSVSDDGVFGETEQLALFGSDVTVDNFEGIAVRAISETTDQIVIISDDNFSDRQRTLIGFLDYDHGS